jgi:hypothetical protein
MKNQNDKTPTIEIIEGDYCPRTGHMDWNDKLSDGTPVEGWVQGELSIEKNEEGEQYATHTVYKKDSDEVWYEVHSQLF